MPTVHAGDLPYQAFNSEVPSPVVPSAYQNIRTSAADFGAATGEGLEKLGRSIGQAADVAAQGAIERQEFENKVKADDYTNKYQESVTKLLYGNPDDPTDTGFLGKRGEDAARAYPDVYKNIIGLRNQMRGQLANDKQRLLFDGETRRTQILTLSHMGSHYDREFKNYATAVNKATAENGMAQAATGLERGDQAAFEDGIGKRMRADLEQAKLLGTANNPEVYNKILGDAREDAVKMTFQKLAETNPYKAWQFLDANSDALKPGEAHALRQTVEAQYRKIRGMIDSGEMPAPEGWNDTPPQRLSSGNTVGTGVGHVAPKTERLAYYQQKAEQLGLNYDAILATVSHEGLNSYVGDNGQSFGDFQLYTGGGMGNETEAAGINIRDPKTWKQQADFALEQMAAHKGDAEWFNGQWHGPRDNAPWAAQQFGKPGPKRVAAEKTAAAKIDYAFGDSNAQLATNHGVPGEVGTDVVVGDSPKASWERMQARGAQFFAGKSILLSPGSSNDPTQVEFIEKQAAFAQQAGAKGVVIPGVGPGIPGGAKAADLLNAQLAGIAEKYGARFVMPDNWQKDGYHIAQVPKFLEKANAALQTGTPVTAPKTTPQVQGKGQPVTQSQLREPSGSSPTPEELDLLEGGGGGEAPDEIAGQTPSIKGLKLAPIPPPDSGEPSDASIPGLTERIADIASQPWAKDNPTRLMDAIKAARAGANARWTEQQRTLRLHQEQSKMQATLTQDDYLKRMYPGSPNPPSIQEILQDERLREHPEVKRTLTSFLEREGKSDPAALVSKENTMKLFDRMNKRDGAEDKITTEDPFNQAYISQQVTRQDHDWLVTQFRGQRSAGGETVKNLKTQMIAAVKPAILGPLAAADERLVEPENAMKLYNYIHTVDEKIEEYQKAGKNPVDLFNPKKPDFVGSDDFLRPFSSTMGEKIRDKQRAATPQSPAAVDLSKIPDADLIQQLNSRKLDYDTGIKELERRGYGHRPAAPVR